MSASLESVPKKARREFSASEKLRILKAAEAAVRSGRRGALGEVQRREGIYSSHISAWREQLGMRGAAGLEAIGVDESDFEIIEITGRGAKKNHAQRLSTAIAQKVADALRGDFPDIAPDEDGGGHESLSAGAEGVKKLDVNYSTKRSGLELAVSIKTMNFRDEETRRYTKNTKRIDGELRAEAQDCHKRFPYAVLAACFFLPVEAANDGKGRSSLKHNADVFARRAGRKSKDDDPSLFEFVFIGLYRDDGTVRLFPATPEVPPRGVPEKTMTFTEVLAEIRRLHAERNRRR
ncbi:MAG: hypothetical protein ACK6CU_10755 [Deltaproteobacteria bacterium]